jgi:D-xylose transport system substrate-binding protein
MPVPRPGIPERLSYPDRLGPRKSIEFPLQDVPPKGPIRMLKRILALLAVFAAAVTVAACGSDEGSSGSGGSGGGGGGGDQAKGKVGVILPDAASSPRWETQDRKYLGDAFKAAGVDYEIQNANGDKAKFATIADQMINSGVSVLMIVNLDSPSGATVIKKAHQQGVPVIDYDRLTLGGGADYYVSFDNVAVGRNIGEGLVKCMQDNGDKSGPVALLNGSPTDNNATLFKQGYEGAIKKAGYTVAADQSVPDWDNTKAGTIFEQMYTKANGNFVGVAAANDGLGGAVAAVLNRNGDQGKVPTTGQDATAEGLQRVLTGAQCLTVYKAVKKEADAASKLAIDLTKGDKAAAEQLASGSVKDTETGQNVKSVLLQPESIFPDDVKKVVADGFVPASDICTSSALKKACQEHGVS